MDSTVSFPANWTPPPELTRAIPRETRIAGRGMLNIILGAVFLIAALALGFWLYHEGAQDRASSELLRAQGQEANGEITSLSQDQRGRAKMVSYIFTANGIRIKGEASVPADQWPSIQKAGFLKVRFLPSNPAVNHPAAWDESNSTPAWFPVLVPSMWAVGSVILLITLFRQRKVAAEGQPAAGVVTKCFRVKGGWATRYQFRMRDGTVGEGRDRVFSRLEPGSAVCVLYLPENPRRNYLYPLSLYRIQS
jgi:Protein of unknown function (DUF3592)